MVLKLLVAQIRQYSSSTTKTMKYLNVAEKNDAAKTIANFLSNGTSQRREGLSKFNKIYEFKKVVRGQQADMKMTSVSGHLLALGFGGSYKGWQNCNPEQLFEAPVHRYVPENFIQIQKTLEKEIRDCHALIIWTDCDREGEHIGFEVIEVCRKIKSNIHVYRAKFSDMTAASLNRALDNLVAPDDRINQAVNVRIELDLRIGAAFTRFQTLRMQMVFPNKIMNNLVSYGSCQIPTLGFVAQRYKEIENFIPQDFWKIKMNHTLDDLTVEFNWMRNRIFDKQCCESLLMVCQETPTALVVGVQQKPKKKWRPLPMDTVELEKTGSRKLKLTAKVIMTIAEKLYTQGLISYPRTETNTFSKDVDLRPLVSLQTASSDWGNFAEKVLQWGPDPRTGTKSDNAHPPIHPTKFSDALTGNEKRVYELVCRHFLACVSKDAVGSETIVNTELAGEEFTATGLIVLERNYLEVYIYDGWKGKEIHHYIPGHTFQPTELDLHEGSTSPPSMLTEADLISLMEKHGIGTDATHADHINTIKERSYIGERDQYLVPGNLGMGLVEGYGAMNLELAQPNLRAGLEIDLKMICEGRKDPEIVLAEQIAIYKAAYQTIASQARKMDIAMGIRLNENPGDPPPPNANMQLVEVFNCPKCKTAPMVLKENKDTKANYISCSGFPACRNAIWLQDLKQITVSDDVCTNCRANSRKVNLKFKQSHFIGMLVETAFSKTNGFIYTTCLVCDAEVRQLLGIKADSVKDIGSIVDSSYNNNRSNTAPVARTNPQPTVNRNNPPPPPNGNIRGNGNTNTWHNRREDDDDDDYRGSGGGAIAITSNSNKRSAEYQNHENHPNVNFNHQGAPKRLSLGKIPDMNCPKCNNLCRKITVKKDNDNKGRPFYKCANESCNFFKWADENGQGFSRDSNNQSNQAGSSNNSNTSSWGRNDHQGSSRSGSSSSSVKSSTSKRKCGICKQEGHNKLKCPTIM